MIIRDSQLGVVNYTTPKLIIVEVTPSPVARAGGANETMIVGQFTRGLTTKLYRVETINELIRKLGARKEGLDGFPFVEDYFKRNGSVAQIARVATSGGVEASVTITDGETVPTDLFELTFESFGTSGNYTKVDIRQNYDPSNKYFDMTVRNTESGEQKSYKKVTTDSTDARFLETIIGNDAGRFFNVVVAVDDGTLPEVGSFSMSGGTNGTNEGSAVVNSAYVGTESGGNRTGIQLGKSQNAQSVSLVLSARNNDTINTELIAHVEDLKVSPRRTIVTLSGVTVEQAITARQAIDSDKVKFMFPNVMVENPTSGALEEHNVTAFAGAIDSVLSYHQSASQEGLGSRVKDLALDIGSDIDLLTANQINPVVLQQNRGYIFASDYTCSSNTSLIQNVVRKAKDYFARRFYDALQFYISKPIDEKLYKDITRTLSDILRQEATARRIGNSRGGDAWAVKCDADNNDGLAQQNRVRVDVEISLLAPADIIMLYLDAQQDKTIVGA